MKRGHFPPDHPALNVNGKSENRDMREFAHPGTLSSKAAVHLERKMSLPCVLQTNWTAPTPKPNLQTAIHLHWKYLLLGGTEVTSSLGQVSGQGTESCAGGFCRHMCSILWHGHWGPVCVRDDLWTLPLPLAMADLREVFLFLPASPLALSLEKALPVYPSTPFGVTLCASGCLASEDL